MRPVVVPEANLACPQSSGQINNKTYGLLQLLEGHLRAGALGVVLPVSEGNPDPIPQHEVERASDPRRRVQKLQHAAGSESLPPEIVR